MRTVRIHTRQPLAEGERVELEPEPARHLIKVLRQRAGDPVVLFCGDGLEYTGTIAEAVVPDRCSVIIENSRKPAVESPLAITLVQAVARGERMDWCIQKACELGVSAIVPVFTERTEVRLAGARRDRRRGHWQRVAIAACEQSGRCRVPEVAAPAGLTDTGFDTGLRLYLDPQSGLAPLQLTSPEPLEIVIAVGPEGGFTESEARWLDRQGFCGLRLGPRVLRAETAGPAAIAALQTCFGDWR